MSSSKRYSKAFERQEMYGVYLTVHDWLRVMECLFKDPEYSGLAEYIGDDIGTLISIHPKSFSAKHSCDSCMHRDQCVIQTVPPICCQYLNYEVKESGGQKHDI